MQHPFFAHRRTLVAVSFAGLALLAFAPKSYGKIPDAASVAVRKQPTSSGAWEPSWASEREQSPTRSLGRPGLPTAPPVWAAQREVIPEIVDTHVARVDSPATSDWTDELALGTGLLAALSMAGGMTLVFRHRRTVSTIRELTGRVPAPGVR